MANTIRIQALPKFPASVEAGDGIVIARSGGVFTFSIDPGAGIFQLADPDLMALANNSTNGLWARTGAGAGAARTLAGTANEITVSNGDGVSGAPTFSLPTALTFSGKTITGGTYSSLTISGAVTITAAATVSGAWVFDHPPTSRLIDAGAGAGPLVSTFRDSATPAASDLIGHYSFFGRDSAANVEEYARLQGTIVDPASGSEDSALQIWTVVNGTLASRASWYQGLVVGSPAGGDKGAGTLNLAGDLYNNNTAPTGTGAYVRAVSPTFTSGPTVPYDDDGALAGPLLSLYRNSASPAANDLIAHINFYGRDSATNVQEYARVQGAIVDPTSTSEDGQLSLQTVVAGAFADRLNVAQGVWIGSATGTDKGVGTLNLAEDLYNNNASPTGTGGYVRATSPTIATPSINTINLTGGQITFPAVANLSSDPNTLDDYEEGTWTPSITFASPGDLSIAYVVRIGVYTKIGRLVALNWVTLTSTFTHATAGGACSITGLPFTSANVANQHAYGGTNFSGVVKASYFVVTHGVLANTAAVSFFTVGIGSGAALLNAADMPTGGTVQLSGGVQFVV